MACSNCLGKGLRALVSRKLGRCPKCMRLSARGTLISWLITAGMYLVLPNPYLIGLTLLVATSFTLLWISHTIAFTLRVGYALKEVRHAEPDEQGSKLQRRQFIPALGRLALFSLFGSLALQPSRSIAQREKCEDSGGEITIQHEERQAIFLCASDDTSAKIGAMDILCDKSTEVCDGFCDPIGSCKSMNPEGGKGLKCFVVSRTVCDLKGFTCPEALFCYQCHTSGKTVTIKCSCQCL